MKISPIAASAAPQSQPAVQQGGVAPDRRAAAINAALGAGKLAPSDSNMDPQVLRAQENMRKVKLKTNFSTDRIETPEVFQETTESAQSENGIPDESSEAEAVIEETKPLSPQFAALARQKRALQVKEREIAQREAALANSQGTTPGGYQAADIKADPLGVLQAAGVDYNQLTEAILANPIDPKIAALEAKIKALEEGVTKTFSDRDSITEKQVMAELRRETDRLVAEGDAFEMIRETGSQSDVTDLIHEIYKTEGEILDVREAAALVEDELLKEAEKIARIKKLQGRLSAPQDMAGDGNKAPQQRTVNTLTNRDGARVPLSRRERAIAAFHNKR